MLDRADCADFGCHNSIRLETKHFLNTLALTFISFSGRFVFAMQKHYLFFFASDPLVLFAASSSDLTKWVMIHPFWKKLHWLPIQHRIIFKYNLLVFKAINLLQPPHLSALIRSSSLTRGNRLSVSSTRPKKHIGRRGFAVASPAEWNKLPQTVKQ